MAKRTYAALVLDKSGSMAKVAAATVSTYNEQVEQLQINSREGEDILVSLVTFNANVYEHLWNVPAADLQLANLVGYRPGGGTNIWDSMGHVIDRWQTETDIANPDNYYCMWIISDGEHNEMQTKWTAMALNCKVTSLQTTGRWMFSMLGNNKNYLEQFAQMIGIPKSNLGTWSTASNAAAVATTGNLQSATANYFAARKSGGPVGTNYYNATDMVADFAAGVEAAPGINVLQSGQHINSTHYRSANLIRTAGFDAIKGCQPVTLCMASAAPVPEDLSAYKLGTADVFGNSRKV